MGSSHSTLTAQLSSAISTPISLRPSSLSSTTIRGATSPLATLQPAVLTVTITEDSSTPPFITITETSSTPPFITITETLAAGPTQSPAITSRLSQSISTPTVKPNLPTSNSPNGGGSEGGSQAPSAAGVISALAASQSPTSILGSNPTALPLIASSNSASGIPVIAIKQPTRGPFTPGEAILGGIPTTSLDVPITVVFLILFLIGAVTHFTIHELNGKRGHKFHLSDMVFDFCMVRTVTTTMRIVWAFRPTNNSIVLAALIFENAGVVVLFAVNIILTQRCIRAIHPRFGWNPIASKFVIGLLGSVVFIIIWNIISLTTSFFTLNPSSQKKIKGLTLFGATYTMTLSILPIIALAISAIIPSPTPVEKFGSGRFRFKIVLLVFASSVLFVGSITRLIALATSRPTNNPATVDSKTVFYTTGFMLEIIVVFIYAVARVDLMFHVPDGCTGPGDYRAGYPVQSDEEKLFQDVDIKMRLSVRSDGSQSPSYGREIHNSQAQVRQAIRDLELNSGISGQYLDTGDSEVILYAFRVKNPDGSPTGPRASSAQVMAEATNFPQGLPRRPPRSSSWMAAPRNGLAYPDYEKQPVT